MTRERRSQARESPEPLGFIQISRDDGGRIRNISETGLCFEAFAPIERARLLQFWFSLDLRERVEAKGRLAWLDPRQEIGGVQFLDLSPKARRHLRTYLGAHAVPQPVTLPNTNSPPKLAADFRAHARKGSERPAAGRQGSTFLAALAKHSLHQFVPAPQAPEASASAALGTQAADSRGEPWPDLASPQSEARATPWNPMSFVSLERHLTSSRKQLLRGVLLGGVIALVVGAAGGWYLGRRSARSEASPATRPAANPSLPATTPISDVSVSSARPASSNSDAPRPASAPRNSQDNPPRGAAPSPSISTANLSARQPGSGPASSRDNGAKGAKKSAATPQQLWASIQAGNMKAAVELADRFIRGDGVPVNCDQARVLLLVASEKNNADAIKKLRDLDKSGCPPQ